MSASSKKQLRKEQNAQMMTERQKQAQAEAKQLKVLTVVFSVIIIAIAAAFLITQVVSGISRSGVVEKSTIALTVNEHKLNSVVMNYYLHDAISTEYNNAYNTYSDYTASYFKSMGLDLSKPLDEQEYAGEAYETWADYYKAIAIENAKGDYALYDLAMADESYKLSEDAEAGIANTMAYMQLYAQFSGASSVDMYLRSMYGNGSTEKSYEEYTRISTIARDYYSAHMDSLTYTDADLRDYEADRYNNYSSYNFQSYYLNHTSFLEGGTQGEDGKTTYSDAETEAARDAAHKAAQQLTEATTVEELDKAIAELSINAEKTEKPTSTANTNVMHTSLNKEYADWLGAADRKEGDVSLFPNKSTTTDADGKTVEVVNGYYVLMYVSTNHNLEKLANVRHILFNFEGGTTDDNGNTTYSPKEKEAAKAKAEDLLKKWKDGEATEESFIALVHDNTGDEGSKETGGLYEDIHRDSNYEQNFLDWAIVAERKAGDTGIVETSYGYHVMYYVGDDELTYRDYMIQNELISNDMESWHEGILEKATVTEGNFSKVDLDLVYSPAN